MARRNHFDRKAGGFIERDHNHDGIDRGGFLKCMAWTGTGALCVIEGGVLKSYALGSEIALFPSGVAFDLISRGRPTSLWASAVPELDRGRHHSFSGAWNRTACLAIRSRGKMPQRLAAVTSRGRRVYGVSSGCDLDAALAGSQDRKGHPSPVSHFAGIARRGIHCSHGASWRIPERC